MKFIFLLPAFLFSSLCFSQKVRVQFPVTYIKPYCGGARPSEEITAEAEKPKPYANKTLIIVNAANKVDSIKTDEKGYFRKKMKHGQYKVYEAWRYNLYTPNNLAPDLFDRTCLLAEWDKPCMTISIDKKMLKQTLINPIRDFCDWDLPCMRSNEIPPGRQ